MTYISLRTFQPTTRHAGTFAANIATVLAALRRRYRDAMQRRALAGLSMPELKDLGYPADEAPADVAAGGRLTRQRPLR
ncbi:MULTISPECIES: DUF1127 domain-containing protein [unclassified Mesorhizobium]|uniref:DUF1127 domain-containing protein n=1 Tax=unclassified Mesorhizobium TaxID=325217 RepID=UPI000BB02E4F|nr:MULTISPECIES: DUF1127 domain-containing protein [unclassified Mesorhizobium]TGT57460.1 DUF1127 domain-containing protein [Mesorhizobium sp. M00.F.Ca.ET.170.01.1.1]AZO11809.1 DUF1127 domain-containing protein [Mesorhizobium sp. M3A.F.Ca.ET.080.04.2.1]PBB86296.1 hypothetical protein CK216_14470 [Mesorhizobium sp. WSM3876]RWB73089.1 MAG: DUF1127 domain-containing protein [Mesorhizobium sp.]RWB87175.1 MAG: DUF1127 domain-containing protein [Mesorhizobium sp.]